jgi:hypothetical protein
MEKRGFTMLYRVVRSAWGYDRGSGARGAIIQQGYPRAKRELLKITIQRTMTILYSPSPGSPSCAVQNVVVELY